MATVSNKREYACVGSFHGEYLLQSKSVRTFLSGSWSVSRVLVGRSRQESALVATPRRDALAFSPRRSASALRPTNQEHATRLRSTAYTFSINSMSMEGSWQSSSDDIAALLSWRSWREADPRMVVSAVGADVEACSSEALWQAEAMQVQATDLQTAYEEVSIQFLADDGVPTLAQGVSTAPPTLMTWHTSAGMTTQVVLEAQNTVGSTAPPSLAESLGYDETSVIKEQNLDHWHDWSSDGGSTPESSASSGYSNRSIPTDPKTQHNTGVGPCASSLNTRYEEELVAALGSSSRCSSQWISCQDDSQKSSSVKDLWKESAALDANVGIGATPQVESEAPLTLVWYIPCWLPSQVESEAPPEKEALSVVSTAPPTLCWYTPCWLRHGQFQYVDLVAEYRLTVTLWIEDLTIKQVQQHIESPPKSSAWKLLPQRHRLLQHQWAEHFAHGAFTKLRKAQHANAGIPNALVQPLEGLRIVVNTPEPRAWWSHGESDQRICDHRIGVGFTEEVSCVNSRNVSICRGLCSSTAELTRINPVHLVESEDRDDHGESSSIIEECACDNIETCLPISYSSGCEHGSTGYNRHCLENTHDDMDDNSISITDQTNSYCQVGDQLIKAFVKMDHDYTFLDSEPSQVEAAVLAQSSTQVAHDTALHIADECIDRHYKWQHPSSACLVPGHAVAVDREVLSRESFSHNLLQRVSFDRHLMATSGVVSFTREYDDDEKTNHDDDGKPRNDEHDIQAGSTAPPALEPSTIFEASCEGQPVRTAVARKSNAVVYSKPAHKAFVNSECVYSAVVYSTLGATADMPSPSDLAVQPRSHHKCMSYDSSTNMYHTAPSNDENLQVESTAPPAHGDFEEFDQRWCRAA